jgi:hypothetical protein
MMNEIISIDRTMMKYNLPKSYLAIPINDGLEGDLYERLRKVIFDITNEALQHIQKDASLTAFYFDPEKEVSEHGDQELDAAYSLPYFSDGRVFVLDKNSIDVTKERIR